jgi:hypothetical protein
MNDRTKTGLEILQAAAVIGLLGNLLLRQTPWGLNAFLFVTVFVVAMIAVAYRRRPEILTLRSVSLMGAMVFFASMFLIRDAEELLVWDTFAILIIMGVLVLPNFGINQRVAGAFHYGVGFLWSGISSAFAPFVLLGSDIEWNQMPGNRLSKSIFAVLRGLAVALPLLLIFGALFMAADAAYEGMINRAFNFDVETIVSHVMLTSLFAWLTAGYFRGTLVDHFVPTVPVEPTVSPIPNSSDVQPKTEAKRSDASFVDKFTAEPADTSNSLPNNATVLEHINRDDWNAGTPAGDESEAKVRTESDSDRVPADLTKTTKRDWQNFDNSSFPSVFTLGTVETVIILGLVNVLFLSFVVMQVPYLFGGMDLVQNTPDFKLAEYARRGFGELVAVAALVLPMLLLSHWLLRKEAKRLEGIFRIFAGIQIALLFVIMASAVQRLVLLTGELGYGWTTVRFYPMVFMAWLAVVFVWFGVTVLRGKRNNFAWGALWSAIVILGATNLMNPHAFIAGKNIQLMQQGRDFDAYYNAELSDDAVPTIVGAFTELSQDDQIWVFQQLAWKNCRKQKEEYDLRSWNLSRQTATQALAPYAEQFSGHVTTCEAVFD